MTDQPKNAELLILKDQLVDRLKHIIDTRLTPKQQEALKLYAQGLTIEEIAEKLVKPQERNDRSIKKS